MLSLSVNIDELNREINALPEEIAKEQKDHMDVVGLFLVSEAKLDFEEKSREGTSHGIKWDPLKESTEIRKAKKNSNYKHEKGKSPPKSQINVDRGLLRNSQTPGFSHPEHVELYKVAEQGEVTVGYGMDYAKYVDEKRQLLPDEAPKEWVDECELMTLEWLEELIRKRLE